MKNRFILGLVILAIGIGLHFFLEGGNFTFTSGLISGLGLGLILSNLMKLTKN